MQTVTRRPSARRDSRSATSGPLALSAALLAGLLASSRTGRAADPSLAPRALHDAKDGSVVFEVLVTCWSDESCRPAVHSVDRPDVILFPSGEGDAASTVGFVGRVRGEAPREFVVLVGETSVRSKVLWNLAKPDPNLLTTWRVAVRSSLQAGAGVSDAWRDFAIDRLDVADGRDRGDFLRAQNRWRRSASLFDLTTGRTAIEESLQLERFRGTGRDRKQASDVEISSIEGLNIREHPWQEMLAGRNPAPHPIERFLPLDQYAFEAASFRALIELADWMDEHGSPLLALAEERSEDSGVKERIERQLCLPSSALSRTLGPLVIERVAATGGDPYLREGSDLTLVFQLKAQAVFFANLEKNRKLAEVSYPGARRLEVSHGSHAIEGLVSDLREVSSYSALVDGHGLVSNSLVGLQRALDAFDGKIPSQDEGLDRKFVRTQLERGEAEDAFLFLSDPSIRRLVSPELRLRESRRLECSTSLRSIAHAASWRQLRAGEPSEHLSQLVDAGDLPEELLFCPDAGRYELLPASRGGRCSIHGHLDFLTPNAELELTRVTREEANAYGRFRDTYRSYWSRFFDPIGMQISSGIDGGVSRRRFETIILPLIELSEYRNLVDFCGGEGAQSGPLDEVSADTTLLLSSHLNREGTYFKMGDGIARETHTGLSFGWIGDRVSLFLRDAPEGLDLDSVRDPVEDAARLLWNGYPGGLRIAVRNKLLLAGFLTAIRTLIDSSAPGAVRFETLEPIGGIAIVKISDPDADTSDSLPDAAYYAIVGGGFYVSLDLGTLRGVIEAEATRRDEKSKENGSASGANGEAAKQDAVVGEETVGPTGTSWFDGSHLAFALDLSGSPRWRAILVGFHEKSSREKCVVSRARLSHLRGIGRSTPDLVRQHEGAVPRCPLGGELSPIDTGFHCSVCDDRVTGDLAGAEPPARDASLIENLEHLRVSLRFTEDGVRTIIELAERR